ncbi:MAG: excinuclease ABC subunit A [candidate division Zixibacteria bacterium SM23_73_3]|nr:MAG: excinuclease ABC subunit A [candidate division Zixibacteria bacterium SM23_73_3]
MGENCIRIKGARKHNLKNIDLKIPRDRLVVITGLSGSGKSSLAFDTIYAEGQRRYVESLSAYARQFLGMMEKPDVDFIEGLSPAVSIEQRSSAKNPRSTVGTVTEIYDYLRLLYARVGTPYCHKCGRKISQQTVQQIVDLILSLPKGKKIQILAPLVKGRKGEYKEVFDQIRREGFIRARVDGKIIELEGEIKLEKYKKHNIEVVVDRLVVNKKIAKRLADSLETALKLGSGMVMVDLVRGEELLFSEHYACVHCGISYEEFSPRMFSFNSPYGACPTCSGLGTRMEIDPDLVVPDPTISIAHGAIAPWGTPISNWYYHQLKSLAEHYKFSLYVAFAELNPQAKQIILYGTGTKELRFRWEGEGGKGEYYGSFEGVIPNLERRYRQTQSEAVREWIEKYMRILPCPDCNGTRLKKESLSVKVGGFNIAQLTELSVKETGRFFAKLKLSLREQQIAKQILKEIKERLGFLMDVGLDYLTLGRSAASLSGGEAQRIRLATQIGSRLVGVLYILDEPSVGLHQRDNKRLLGTLLGLKNLGNTVLVVEHDRETIETADHVIDLGPGAGKDGGWVVAQGTPEIIKRSRKSLTGKYLSGRLSIPLPAERKNGEGAFLSIMGAKGNNLKRIRVDFPLGVFICVTGVSGSGKSTLINETIYRILAQHFYNSKLVPLEYEKAVGLENVDKVINIDQSPIGRTPRSNPATYTGVFTPIRDLFALLPEAKVRGYKPGRFSFNVQGGRCEACEGDGIIKIEMHFLPDVYVPCEVCKGKRYNRETLEIKYKGKNIADVLDMTVDEAYDFFTNIPKIKRKLQTLKDVGLGYIHLGQPATTLSGGEAQRVKLSTELSKVSTGRTFYILDEPTTGLHFEDVKMLLGVLNKLVDMGNTVVVIEHNLDVIKTADYIVDLGPEGGDDGGKVVATGTPEEVAKIPGSYTGKFLKGILEA